MPDLDPDLEHLIRSELNYRKVRRAPAGGTLAMGLGLMAAFFGLYAFGAILRWLGLQ